MNFEKICRLHSFENLRNALEFAGFVVHLIENWQNLECYSITLKISKERCKITFYLQISVLIQLRFGSLQAGLHNWRETANRLRV
jgi:hypothetical protein